MEKCADAGNDCRPQKGVEQDVEAGNQARMAEVISVNENEDNQADSHPRPGKVFDDAEMRLDRRGEDRRSDTDRKRYREKMPRSHFDKLAGAGKEFCLLQQYLSSGLFTECPGHGEPRKSRSGKCCCQPRPAQLR